jgi:hypothetical protein
VDAVVEDRACRKSAVIAVRRSLGRPYPCPPRVRPANSASRLKVLAQRQGLWALPSLTRTKPGLQSREHEQGPTPHAGESKRFVHSSRCRSLKFLLRRGAVPLGHELTRCVFSILAHTAV